MRYLILHILICVGFSLGALAQTETDQQLAAQYFKNSEYDKAAVLYEKMYRKTRDEFFYQYYIDCLVILEDFDEAEKVVSNRLRKEQSGRLMVQLGNIYKRAGQGKKANQQFEAAIKNLEPSKVIIDGIAKQFEAIGEIDLAISTMKKGRKLLNGAYGYGYELADLYGSKGSFDKQLEEYFGILEFNPHERVNVQAKLLETLADDDSGQKHEFFMQEVIGKIQSTPNLNAFPELLIWHHMQRKEFRSAFNQSKALDRRNKEDGARIIEIADVASTNSEYDLAVEAYRYVIKKGMDNYFYHTAKMDMVQTMKKKITRSGSYTIKDLEDLENSYLTALEELGRNANSVKLLRGLAELYVFYMDRVDDGIALLHEAKDTPGITRLTEAESKVELADALLFSGDIWEATLLYSQAEKSYKNDELGRMAKLKNAKLAYFTGQFEWAQAQLNVLKSATSQFIANDALYLAMLISDNSVFDTTYTALSMFARADLLIYRNKQDSALVVLDSIDTQFPGHSLADDILYKRAQIAMARREYEIVEDYLHEIWQSFTFDLLADDAVYELGLLNEEKLGKPETAMEYYQEILLNYPGSLYTIDARKRYRTLRGDLLN